MTVLAVFIFAGKQAGRHLLLTPLCPHGWKTDRGDPGGQESEKDGCRWIVRSVACANPSCAYFAITF